MNSICGIDCGNCSYCKNGACVGCKESKGCPFGKSCFIAKYITVGGKENYDIFVLNLIDELNALKIPGMPRVSSLNALVGEYVNLEYTVPSGEKIKLLDDKQIYLGNQLECEFSDGEKSRCFGVVGNADFLLVCTYGENGSDPELVTYRKR